MNAQTQGGDHALDATWSAYRRSAATARAETSTLRNWRWRVLAITLAGAVISAAADALRQPVELGALPSWLVPVAGITGAMLLALATFLTANLLTTARQRRWTQSRAVAEALKSECFRFATRMAPYDGNEAPAKLLDRLERMTRGMGGSLLPEIRDEEKATLCAPITVADYLKQRVHEQIQWYRNKALAARNSLLKFRYASVALGAIAAVLPVVGTLTDAAGPASWAAVATTAGTAIASFVYAERFGFLVESYSATANRLELLAARWHASTQTSTDEQLLVDSVENALATENTGWMAELLKEED